MFRTIILGASATIAVLLLSYAALRLYGAERFWTRVAGPADLGAVDFASLTRRKSGNDALACSPGACRQGLGRRIDLPVYRPDPAALMAELDRRVLDGRDVERVDDGSRAGYRRYVARSRLMRFPDTIDAEASPAEDGHGTLLRLYSRSQLGKGDFGANARRMRSWAQRLSQDEMPGGS